MTKYIIRLEDYLELGFHSYVAKESEAIAKTKAWCTTNLIDESKFFKRKGNAEQVAKLFKNSEVIEVDVRYSEHVVKTTKVTIN